MTCAFSCRAPDVAQRFDILDSVLQFVSEVVCRTRLEEKPIMSVANDLCRTTLIGSNDDAFHTHSLHNSYPKGFRLHGAAYKNVEVLIDGLHICLLAAKLHLIAKTDFSETLR